MKPRHLLCLSFCLAISSLASANENSSGPGLSRFDINYRGMISAEAYSAGNYTDFNHLQVGFGTRIAWAFSKNFYTEAAFFGQPDTDHAADIHTGGFGTTYNMKVLENLVGVQKADGPFIPYAELDNYVMFVPGHAATDYLNYDVGITLDYFEKFAPTFEVDSFGNRQQLYLAPQLMVFFNPRWSILIEYDYYPYQGYNSLDLRLNYAFST